MALQTSVEVEGGRAVVCHRADGTDKPVLEEAADALRRAAGPGVVAIVRAGRVAGGFELVTEHGGMPVDAHRLGSAAALARWGADAATALDGLHARGGVHGALDRHALLVASDGSPRLHAFGSDPHATPVDDLVALCGVLRSLSAELPPATGRDERSARDQLAIGLDMPPAPHRLAADLAAVGSRPSPAGGAARRPRPVLIAGLLVVVVLSIVALGSAERDPERAAPGAPSSTRPSRSSTTTTLPPCVVDEGATEPGCPQVIVVDGPVVSVDGQRAVVGRPGDQLLVGDWGCEGTVRPAVLRPTTGEVLVYGPVAADGSIDVVQAERIEGATGLTATEDEAGCSALLVVTDEGTVRLT